MLGKALLASGKTTALASVLQYVEGALREHWDTIHPQLDEDDGDPTMRVNAVRGLADRDELLSALRQAPLVESRAFGRVSLRDMEYASGDVPPPAELDTVLDLQTISAAFQDAGAEAVGEVQSCLAASEAAVREIASLLDAQVGVDAPNLDPLLKMLLDIQRRLSLYGGAPAPEATDDDAAPGEPAAAPVATGGAPGAITSPQDVRAALERIMAYYARYEPSSPLPLLLDRAKRLVGADFVTIMKDMAPLGVENIALIGGFEPNEGEEGTY
jgi:type VI secretion system protein ImpA